MKEKFDFIYEMVASNMKKLDAKKIDIENAKAMASLAKQANNVLATQIQAAKFISNNENATVVIIILILFFIKIYFSVNFYQILGYLQ